MALAPYQPDPRHVAHDQARQRRADEQARAWRETKERVQRESKERIDREYRERERYEAQMKRGFKR